eukprot:scaffold1301_cov135-Isochrysis_galbana.AAC.3
MPVRKEEATTMPSPSLRSPVLRATASLIASYVESCTADATITRGANAESPRKSPEGPSARRMESNASAAPPDRASSAWKRVLTMKNGLEASAAKPPDTAARPSDLAHLTSGASEPSPMPVADLAAPYTPKRTDTFENCHRHDGPRPRCKPRTPSVRPTWARAESGLRYGLGFPGGRLAAYEGPTSVIRVLTTSIGLVKQMAPTAAVPAQRNSPYHGLEAGLPDCAIVRVLQCSPAELPPRSAAHGAPATDAQATARWEWSARGRGRAIHSGVRPQQFT